MTEAKKGEKRREGKRTNYAFLLLIDREKSLPIKEIHRRLIEHGHEVSLATLYNWSAKWKRADREAREMGKAL